MTRTAQVLRTPASRMRRLAIAVAVIVVSACDGPGSAAQATDPVDVRPGDLHVLPATESLAVVEDLEALPDGADEASGTGGSGGNDGNVWVLNSVPPFFIGFTSSGDSVATHGREGGGPEKFMAPAGFVVGGLDGDAWVFDHARHALIRISAPGEARSEISLPRETVPPGSVMPGMGLMSRTIRIAGMGNQILLPRRSGSGEVEATSFWTTIWNAELIAFDPGTGSVRTVLSFGDAMGDLAAHFESLSDGFPPFPFWYRLWAVCSDREIRLYDFVRDELRGFTLDGVEVDPVPAPPPFTEATPIQFARAGFDLAAAERAGAVTPGMAEMSPADSAQILDGLVRRLAGTPRQLAGLLPKYVDFRCSDDGSMWLRPLDLERGGMSGGPVWLKIAPDGERHEVRFPDRFDPYRFTAGRVWGVLRDELDVASVAWVEDPVGR